MSLADAIPIRWWYGYPAWGNHIKWRKQHLTIDRERLLCGQLLPDKKFITEEFSSNKCSQCLNAQKNGIRQNVECICGKMMSMKAYRRNRSKVLSCSRECDKVLRAIWMSGEGNHQFGLRGPLNASWEGGVHRDNYGYIWLWAEGHPNMSGEGYVKRARLVVEERLGRYLSRDELVHHINEIKNDDRPDNLEVMTRSEHTTHHNKLRWGTKS